MRAFRFVRFLMGLSLATAIFAQAQAPKPDPHLKQLSALAGRWTYEGEYKPGPLGPGGKITGEYTGRTILNGFFYEGRETEKGTMGETHNVEIDAYDPANKNFICNLYQDDGSRFSGTVTVNGNTITWEGKFFAAGQQILFKEPFVMAADRMTGTAKGEISMDGKTWTPFFEATFTKAKPVPNKAAPKK
jgi:Protein of unknown function (DUF1579)